MDGKAPGGAGRRPMLIKQENMMGSPDGYPGNIGVCQVVLVFSAHIVSPSLTIISYSRSWTIFESVVSSHFIIFRL